MIRRGAGCGQQAEKQGAEEWDRDQVLYKQLLGKLLQASLTFSGNAVVLVGP
jgi:hypothetical protein